MQQQTHVFPSCGESCAATLALPDTEQPPVIVLGQGLGAECSMGTGSFVRAFVTAGYAVFSFNYRGFGNSTGQPRQLVDPGHHCEDWYNAIQYVRSLHTIDNQRVALWGSSFAGGHVLVTAARVHGLAGVIAQVPFCSSRHMVRNSPIGTTLANLGHASLDVLLSLLGMQHRVPLLARPGAGFAIMRWPGWYEDYLRIAADAPGWENSMPARGIFAISTYNPIDSAGQIDCPVLLINGARDQGIPPAEVSATAAAIADCQHVELDCDHFDLYEGFPMHEQALDLQCQFLARIFAPQP